MKKKIRTFDRIILSWIRKIPSWMRPCMIFFTTLGLPIFTVGSSALIIGFGIGKQRDDLIIGGSIAIITLMAASLLKLILRRKRPTNDYVEQMFFDTFSFPSGHSAGSVASYGLLCLLLLANGSALALVGAGALVVTVLIIGISRVYLGAHYASDVLGGWIIGIVGLIAICIESGLINT